MCWGGVVSLTSQLNICSSCDFDCGCRSEEVVRPVEMWEVEGLGVWDREDCLVRAGWPLGGQQYWFKAEWRLDVR